MKSYYGAALVGLLAIEARRPTGRRVGSEADARWQAFRGDLTTANRLDLLIRDADAQWPGGGLWAVGCWGRSWTTRGG